MTDRHLILASSSQYRRALLERLMIPFRVISPNIDESPRDQETPQDLVLRLSVEKAATVVADEPNSLVIGSDQVAVHDHKIIGKPGDHSEAVGQLLAASGRVVTLYTGLALINSDTGNTQADIVPYRVRFKHLTRDRIENYLEKERPYSCSGSLRADGLGIALLEEFEGDDPTALIGLPLIRLVSMLEVEGVHPV